MRKGYKVPLGCLLALLVLAVIFAIAWTSLNEEKDEEHTEQQLYRWDVGYSATRAKVKLNDDFGETLERHYTGTISRDISTSMVGGLVAPDGELSQEVLEERYTKELLAVKERVDNTEHFQSVTVDTYDGLVQLAAVTEQNKEQFSVNYRTDGSLQTIYYLTWSSTSESPTPFDIVKAWKSYTGVTLSADDLLRSFETITAIANFGGTYSVFVNDSTQYIYFALTVHDYNTTGEWWECYVSAAEKLN